MTFTENDTIATVTGDMTEVNGTRVDRMHFTRVYRRAPSGHWRLMRSMQRRR